MKPNTLVDLYFPAHVATPDEVARKATEEGLDAVIIVADSLEELPDPDAIAAANDAGGAYVHVACRIAGAGFRVAILIDGDYEEVNIDAIEAAGDPALIAAAVAELGGCALPICPRQGAEGTVLREVAALPEGGRAGILALVANGSRLGRDLDIEDAGVSGRRVLGGTGPFGALDDLGRYCTLVPAARDDLASIISRLSEGCGVGVELGRTRPEAPVAEAPKKKRRRRRRRRGGRTGTRRRPPDAA